MRVRCSQALPSSEQAKRLGSRYQPDRQVFPVRVGEEYVVYAVEVTEGNAWVFIDPGIGYLVPVPLALFSIVDARVSSAWQVQFAEEGTLGVMPPELWDRSFLDELSEGAVEAVRTFRHIRERVAEEKL